MRDEEHRHAVRLFEPGEQFQDLRLHGHVERGGRLVRDQKVRFVGERHCDHDALALAAGKLVRIGAQPLFRVADADLVQEFERARPCRGIAHPPVQAQDFADLLLDRMQRIERGHRLLEDHGDVVAAHATEFLFACREKVPAAEEDLAGRVAGGGVG